MNTEITKNIGRFMVSLLVFLLLLLVVRSIFRTMVTIGDWNNLELEGKKARFACTYIGKLYI